MAAADQELARRIEQLVLQVGGIPDPESREAAHQLIESILELHGGALARIMEITFDAGEPGEALIRRFAGDSFIAALLLLHNLHPDDLETRVQHALGKWHGSAELVGQFEGVVRVRLSGGGCGLKDAVKAAIREAAPDAVEIVIEEALQPAVFVPLSALGIGISGAD